MKHYIKIGKTCIILILLLCLFPRIVRAEGALSSEATSEIVRKNIYHVHIGNAKEGGGCYTEAVTHKHKGNPSEGGVCYNSPIYHLHTGEAAVGGGCFGDKVYHTHKGNEITGGDCYKTPVYHVHEGNTQAGGGCHNSPIYHVHVGDANSGGDCYQPVYHQHTQTCYREEKCELIYVGGMTIERTYTDWCHYHGNTQIAVIQAEYRHSVCNSGNERSGHTMCWTCQSKNKAHTFQSVVCGKNEATIETYQMACTKGEETIDSWQLQCNKNQTTIDRYKNSCGKTEKNVDSYHRNCGKNETSIDAYALSCLKEEGDVEFYVRNCGKEEGVVYGSLSLSNSNKQWTSAGIRLQASYVENSAATLRTGDVDFVWEKDGTVLDEKADQIEAADNGTYTVKVMNPHEDANQGELSVSIQVKNIDKTPPVIKDVVYSKEEKVKSNTIQIQAVDLQPDGSTGSGLAAAPYSYDGGKTWISGDKKEVTENGVIEVKVKDICQNVAAKTITIDNIQTEDDSGKKEEEKEENKEKEEDKDEKKEEEKEEEKEKDENGGNHNGNNGGSGGKKDEKSEEQPPKEKESVTVVQEENTDKSKVKKIFKKIKKTVPVLKKKAAVSNVPLKETETVTPEPKAAEPVSEEPLIKNVSSKKVMSPIVKAFTFTLGGVAGVATLIWMCYLFFMSIRIYHSDGDGKTTYAGSCIIRKTEEIFEVSIPAMILEQSDTGRFNLRLGGLFCKYFKGKELIVEAGQQKIAVWIDKEIPFRVDTYV